jgi:hypothetical protein
MRGQAFRRISLFSPGPRRQRLQVSPVIWILLPRMLGSTRADAPTRASTRRGLTLRASKASNLSQNAATTQIWGTTQGQQHHLPLLHVHARRDPDGAGGNFKPMWEDRERHMRGARLRQCDLAGKERPHYTWEVASDTERYPELPAAADELGHSGVCDVRPSISKHRVKDLPTWPT